MKCRLLAPRQGVSVFQLLLVASLAALLTCSCTSTDPRTGQPITQHFHETSQANLIVNFPGWDSISITRPQMAEGGFMNFYDRAQIGPVLRKVPAERDLAVVVCGFSYTAEQENQQQQIWSSLLSEAGFKRVVFVRAASPNDINGAEVVRELQLNGKSA